MIAEDEARSNPVVMKSTLLVSSQSKNLTFHGLPPAFDQQLKAKLCLKQLYWVAESLIRLLRICWLAYLHDLERTIWKLC